MFGVLQPPAALEGDAMTPIGGGPVGSEKNTLDYLSLRLPSFASRPKDFRGRSTLRFQSRHLKVRRGSVSALPSVSLNNEAMEDCPFRVLRHSRNGLWLGHCVIAAETRKL
jgi:hypothetical protein